MLKIHVLNVSHGDSIVLEFEPEAEAGEGRGASKFAVIDCNARSGRNPALQLLRERGATHLQFIALTHPHADHYAGLGEICEAFRGHVDAFFSFPIERSQEKLRTLLERYATAGATTSMSGSRATEDFLIFIKSARDSDQWDDPVATVPVPMDIGGFPGVSFQALLPMNSARGQVLPRLIQGHLTTQANDLNDLSLAILITYAGRQAVLGADGTVVGWSAQSQRWNRPNSRTSVRPTIVKLPHHGSQKDCTKQVLEQLFPTADDERVAIISANGSSHHPHSSVLAELARMGVKPYCTNLSERCGGTAQQMLAEANPNVSADLLRTIQIFAVDPGRERPCQGNITVEIAASGEVKVVPQYAHPCGFRGDWERLFGLGAVQ